MDARAAQSGVAMMETLRDILLAILLVAVVIVASTVYGGLG